MKKIRLVGKKLYRTGPLKLFKGYGNPGESTYQSTDQSNSSGNSRQGGTNTPSTVSISTPKSIVVRDPVYGTPISLSPAQAQIAINNGAVGPGGDSVSASNKQQRQASNYLDQFKTEAQREEDARKKAEIEKQIDEINEDFDNSKDTRSFLKKIGDVLATGSLAAFSDKLTAKMKKRQYREARRNQGIEEARRLGRIVVIDGLVYKPGMSTTGEQQRLSDAAQKFDYNEEYIRGLGYDAGMSDEQLQDLISQNEKKAAELSLTGEELAAKPKFEDPNTGKMLKMGDEGYEKAKGAYQSRLMQKWEDRVRKRQALMEKARLGTLDKEERKKLNMLSRIPGMGQYVNLLKQGLDIGEVVSKQLTDPVGFNEASEAEASELERIEGGVNEEPQRVEDVTDVEVKQQIEIFNKKGDKSQPTQPSAAGTPAPAPAPAPAAPVNLSLQQQLEKRARGEDLIAEKEGKLARERGLAQQLASIRGTRGVTAGQKLRALQRGGEKLTTQLGATTAIEKAKEQQRAQDTLIEQQEREKDRQAKVPTAAPQAAAPQRSGLSQFLDTASDIQKGWNIGTSLYDDWKKRKKKAEGGYISGPGSETSDSIPARLSDGEFVIKASAVRGLGKSMGAEDKDEQREMGVDFLYKLQDKMGDKVQKFGGGGPVKKKEPEVKKGKYTPSEKYGKLDEDKKRKLLRERQKMLRMAKELGVTVEFTKYKDGGEIKPDYDRFLNFMDKGVNHSLMKKRIQKAKISKEEKEKLLKGLGEEPKFAKGGEAYSRPKKAFREAIGYEPESRFHDKALKDTKFGGARRKFRHFQDGGLVDIKKPDMIKNEFKTPSSGYGSVVAAQGDLMRRIEELERKVGK